MRYEDQYIELIRHVMHDGDEEHNKRTGHKTRRVIGTLISCDLNVEWPLLFCRRMYPKTGAAELAWMLMGTQDGLWLKQHSKIWEKFEEDGLLRAAYGYRWRNHFGRDQITELVDMLQRDPSSRQGVVFAWDPSMDGLENSGKMKNIPCHMGFQACIVNGRLDIMVYQRSLDSIVGLPYDILLYGLLNMALSATLQIKAGKVSIAFGDTHIYDSHFDIAERLIYQLVNAPVLDQGSSPICPWSLSDIQYNPDGYVDSMKNNMAHFKYSDYAPRPEVIL